MDQLEALPILRPMSGLEDFRNFGRPEELKIWPEYIRERFSLLDSAFRHDLSPIKTLLASEEPSLAESPYFLHYLVYRAVELNEANGLPEDQAREVCDLVLNAVQKKRLQILDGTIDISGQLGEPALPLLQELANRPEEYDQPSVIQALGDVGESALTTVAKYAAEDNQYFTRVAAIQALAKIGPPALEALEQLTEDDDYAMRAVLAGQLSAVGVLALPLLESLRTDEVGNVRARAEESIREIRERQAATTQSQSQLTDCTDDQSILARQKLIHSLVVRQEPVFSSDESMTKLHGVIAKLAHVVQKLQEDGGLYPEIVGFCAVGSLTKGYWKAAPDTDNDGSDIDWGLILDSDDSIPRQRENEIVAAVRGMMMSDDLPLDNFVDNSVNLADIRRQKAANLHIMFSGMFFGNRARFRQAKTKFLEATDEGVWRRIQDEWSKMLDYNSDHLCERLNLTGDERDLVIYLRNFLWSPADLETMRKESGV